MTTTCTLYWIRADKQGDYNMGSFATEQEAWDAIPSATSELIEQCPGPVGSDENMACIAEINDGSWAVVAESEED